MWIFNFIVTFILFWYIHRTRLLVYLQCSFGSYKNFWLQLMPKIDGHDCLYCRLKRCSLRYDFSNNLILILLLKKINLFPLSKSTSVILSNFRRPEQIDSCQFVIVQFFCQLCWQSDHKKLSLPLLWNTNRKKSNLGRKLYIICRWK